MGIDFRIKKSSNTLKRTRDSQSRPSKRRQYDSQISKKKLSRQEYMSNNYQKNLEKIPQMAKQKKQQNKQRIPPIKQIPHKKI